MINYHEIVTRYILSSSHYSALNSRVKPRALEPSNSDHCTSVFRIFDFTEPEIWQLGEDNVSTPNHLTLHARADFSVLTVQSLNLDIKPDEPPIRHSLIFGWPTEKHAMMAVANDLAARASLVINPK
ncbi:MAG: hypothetical protein IMZ62_17595 [Chloroflexi bacterium]|nr:hypothetical protein [Chloroflexota bacterium]